MIVDGGISDNRDKCERMKFSYANVAHHRFTKDHVRIVRRCYIDQLYKIKGAMILQILFFKFTLEFAILYIFFLRRMNLLT